MDHVVEERRLPGARDPGQADESPERDRDGEPVQVVLGHPREMDPGPRSGDDRPAGRRSRDGPPAREVGARDAVRSAQKLGQPALEDDVSPGRPGLRSDFQDVVRGPDHRLVVLDDDDRVAGVGQRPDDPDQPVDVARVEPDARLVQDEERVDERGPEDSSSG